MKKTVLTLAVMALALLTLTGCNAKKERRYVTRTITNPVLAGFYPDPSVTRGADGYYMVNSTFGYFPGIPIFYSADLTGWEQIGHVLHRPEQVQFDKLRLSNQGIYAPAIEYHEGTYYVACTEVVGRGNYIVKATHPAGPWSDPYLLPEVNGIDPSLFFDDDGKVYLVYNSDAPDNNPLWDGHCTIRMVEMDMKTMKVKSEPLILVNGGVDIDERPLLPLRRRGRDGGEPQPGDLPQRCNHRALPPLGEEPHIDATPSGPGEEQPHHQHRTYRHDTGPGGQLVGFLPRMPPLRRGSLQHGEGDLHGAGGMGGWMAGDQPRP